MKELIIHQRDSHPDIEYLDDEEQLDKILKLASSYIGRIVIEFNSLEDSISSCIKELVGHSEGSDEQICVFLSEMAYSSKVTVLINLYGQSITCGGLNLTEKLDKLENNLRDAAKYRNQYAHANWAEISGSNYVLVKIKAKKDGVFHSYRKFDEVQMNNDLDIIKSTHVALENFDEEFNEKLQN